MTAATDQAAAAIVEAALAWWGDDRTRIEQPAEEGLARAVEAYRAQVGHHAPRGSERGPVAT